MHIHQVNLSHLTTANCTPRHGYFGYKFEQDPPNYIRWHRCREIFHSHIAREEQPHAKYKYWYVTVRPEPIVKLVGVVETILGIEPSKFAVHWDFRLPASFGFYSLWWGDEEQTTGTHVHLLQIEPSKFWLQQPMRHQFFTCVLRAALMWDQKKNPLQVLKDFPYFYNNKALDYFLTGRTWYTGSNSGWQGAFGWATCTYGLPGGPAHTPEEQLTSPSTDAVKDRAYHVWQEWGHPHGRETDIWNQAERDVGVTRV